MNSYKTDAINKINFPISETSESEPDILWIMAASSHNRDTLTFRPHTHTFFEIHLITEGEVDYGFNGKMLKLCAGQLLVIEPRMPHWVISHSESFLKITLAIEVTEESLIYAKLSALSARTVKADSMVTKDINFISENCNGLGEHSAYIAKCRCREIIYLIASEAASGSIDKKNRTVDDNRVFRAIKHIEDNPQIFFTCEELASYCRLSSKQLGRLFEKHRGCSLLAYIHDEKIRTAKKMLSENDALQETIAKALGFSSVHYFNKFFIRHTGMTPGEYKKSLSE